MRVACPDQPALEKDGQEQNRALLQLIDVHVRAVLPRPERARAALRILDGRARLFLGLVRVRPHRDCAGEGLQVARDAGLELRLLLLPVEVVIAYEALRELRREKTDGGELRAGQVEVGAERLRDD